VTVAVSGDYGKPRPALIVQADVYAEHPSVTVLPLTSELIDAPLLRVTVEPGESSGLRLRSQAMVDKVTTIPRATGCGKTPGAVSHPSRRAPVERSSG
jgi:mRNA interferase MazF